MYTKILSATTLGTNARLVEVEVDVTFGLVQFYIVGLPDTTIKESSKRIMAALKNSGCRIPAKRITVNLAPADLKKEGALFDLSIALGILIATEQLTVSSSFLQETVFLGELSLDGAVRFVKGVLALTHDMYALGKKRIILPVENAQEASLIEGIEVIGVHHITQVVAYLKQEISIASAQRMIPASTAVHEYDFNQVKGQEGAKRALQIAAAGRHNILFVGSPGSGKTMLAQRLASLLPPLQFHEMVEVSKVYSVSGKLHGASLITERPFCAPHHTISQAGLIGGGSYPQPGAISMAHHGILFLDELTEFRRETLEALRQPLESKYVHIVRVHQTVQFPAQFLLVAALNPCPCGFFGDKKRECVCPRATIVRYMQKLSGPFLDRIDLQIHVPAVDYETIHEKERSWSSSQELYKGVHNALVMQEARFNNSMLFNGALRSHEVDRWALIADDAQKVLSVAFEKLRLSMRGYYKIIKIARTIADMDQSETVKSVHVEEAVMYRSLDKFMKRL